MTKRRTPFRPCDASWVSQPMDATSIVRPCAYFRTTDSLTPLDTDAGATQSGK